MLSALVSRPTRFASILTSLTLYSSEYPGPDDAERISGDAQAVFVELRVYYAFR